MEYFYNKGVIEMLKDGMLPTGEKVDLNKFDFPALDLMKKTSQDCFLYDTEKFNILSVNENVLKSFKLESPAELEKKDVFSLEKIRRQQNDNQDISFAHKVINDIENTLSQGNPKIYSSVKSVDCNGYCKIEPSVKIPLFRDNKIKAVWAIVLESTRYEHVEDLYNQYKETYKNNIKKGNRLFLEYLGLSIYDLSLSTREIETLIALAKYRTNAHAAQALDVASGTIDKNVHEIKMKLQNQNITDILLHFTTTDKRKF